ncbi:MAG TPA: MFS transporter [Ktedonobacteraceae bacterium]|nr:MFS transporter [Ktedonobacteraceae bacterium]
MALVTESRRKQALRRTSRGQARFAFTILFIINILNYADRYVLPAILPKIQHDLGLSNTESGLLGSSFLLVYALATLPIGIWADRGIRKNIVALCVGIWSVATMLAGFTQNFIQLFSVRAVLGIGEAGYGPASLSLLGDLFPKTNRGRILSYWSAGTLIGAAIGVTLGGLVANALGWRSAFYLVGIPGLIMAFLAWRLTEPERGAFDHEESEGVVLEAGVPEEEEDVPVTHGSLGADSWGTIKKLVRIPTYWILVVALVFSFFTIGGTSFWLPSYFVNAFKLNVAAAGAISGAVLVSTGLVGTVVGGWLADAVQRRHPEGRLFVAMLGFLLGAPLVLIALFLHSLPMFLAFFVLAGITLNFCTGPLNAVIQDVITPGMRATALGLALLLAHLLGDAAAPTIIGALADKITLATAMIVTAPTFLFIAGFICLLGLRYVARDMRNMEKELQAQRG